MNKKMALFALIIVLILPIVLAQQSTDPIEIGPYKQNLPLDIRVSCTHTGGICSGAASCNITVDFPNSSNMVFNQAMTQNQSFYNYTLPNTRTIGKHIMKIGCVDGSNSVTNDYFFYITETGNLSSTLFIDIIELLLKIVFLGLLMVIALAGRKSYKENKKTPYLLMAILRSLWISISYVIFFISPFLALFLFHPNFDFGIVQTVTMSTYFIIFLIAAPIFILNLFYFGSNMLLKLGGLAYDAKRTNKVLDDLSKLAGKIEVPILKIKNKIFRGK